MVDVAPTPVDVIALPALAPFGKVDINVEGCTLCLACVQACPVSALTDNPDKPQLRFQEDLCVQCGLCAATCPETGHHAPAADRPRRLGCRAEGDQGGRALPLHQLRQGLRDEKHDREDRRQAREQALDVLGRPAKRISVIKIARIAASRVVVNESFDPHASPQRPAVRTTEDYLRERKERGEDPLQ